MTPKGIQVIEPETDLAPGAPSEAIIERFSNGSTDTLGLSISVVRFPPGIRRPWSAHAQDQYAWIISGKGIIISGDGEIELHPGQLVFIPENTMHQHGSSEEEGMTQLSIIGGTEPRETPFAP